MSRKKKALPPPVTDLARDVAEWRNTRQKVSPMPRELWRKAVALAQLFGTAAIARAANLDYSNLKKRVAKLEGRAGAATPPKRETAVAVEAAFVEVPRSAVAAAAVSEETTVEMSSKDGARMVIRMKGCGGPELERLAAAFWRRGS